MSNIIWEGFTGPVGDEVYVDIDPNESREVFTAEDLGLSLCGVCNAQRFFKEEIARLTDTDIIGDIIAACSKLKSVGEEPDMVIFIVGAFPLRVRVKGTSKQKKRARFLNRKSKARLEAMEARYADDATVQE